MLNKIILKLNKMKMKINNLEEVNNPKIVKKAKNNKVKIIITK